MMSDHEIDLSRKMVRRYGEQFTREALKTVTTISPDASSRDARLLLAEYHLQAFGAALLSFQNDQDAEAADEIKRLLDRHLALIHNLKPSNTTH